RRRTTKEQYHILEASYVENPKPTSNTRRKLSSQLNMTTRGVQVWFQNRRAKSKAY
ncbi:homeobox domain-containing protein, partial [Umbelopsis sp. AD052]